MTETDRVFAGSIPEIYDRYLVPLMFESYAEDIARRVAALAPRRVLETAAGSGVVTRALARALPDASLVVTDLSQPMLDLAARRQPPSERIIWRQADALDLPFDDESFDAVVCQFGVMFFPDRIAGYAQARRVLRRGGAFAFNVWDRIEANGFAHAINDGLAAAYPDDPPRFLARAPYGYHDDAVIRLDLAGAGLNYTTTETVEATSRAASARDPAIGFCQGSPLRGEIEARDPAGLDRATGEAARAIANRYGDGPVEAPIRAHVFVAWR